MGFDLERVSGSTNVRFTGSVANSIDYFSAMDVFVLASREDPFPLVVLEAAAQGVPTICFDATAGGACEFVEDDSGIVVPYLDVAAMADAITTFGKSESTRLEAGRRAKEKVVAQHDIESGAARLTRILISRWRQAS